MIKRNPKFDADFAEMLEMLKSLTMAEKDEETLNAIEAYRMGALNMRVVAVIIMMINLAEGTGAKRFRELIPRADRLQYFEQTGKDEAFRVLFCGDSESEVAA